MPQASPELLRSIKSGVVSGLSWAESRRTNLYVDSSVRERGKEIMAYKQRIQLDRDTVFVFADENPRLNWAHPCRYLLFEAEKGRFYREVRAQFPPYLTAEMPETFKAFHEPVRTIDEGYYYPVLPRLRCPVRKGKGRCYAVLFSGASNNRHTNDLEFLYRTLRDLYGFPAANIQVLNYDGAINYAGGPKPVADWPGDSSAYRMPVHGQGTKADLESAFDSLKSKLKKNDLLLVHTNNHGGHNGTESYLCTYSGADYLASEFAAKLGELPEYRCLMVMMEQCHSGGFNAPILANSTAKRTSVSAACEELRSSIGGPHFDPFARDWIAAMTGNTPSGGALASNPDTDGSGKVSAREAHDYAEAVKDPYDTPVYSESSKAAGKCYLGKRYQSIWPIYCRILIEELYPYYERLPVPEFYATLHEKLMPELRDIEAKLEEVSTRQERELAEAIEEITRRVMR